MSSRRCMTNVEYPIGVSFVTVEGDEISDSPPVGIDELWLHYSLPIGSLPSGPPPCGRVVSCNATRTLYGTT